MVRALLIGAATGTFTVWASFGPAQLLSLANSPDPGFAVFATFLIVLPYFLMLFVAFTAALILGGPLYFLIVKRIGINCVSCVALGATCGGLLMRWLSRIQDGAWLQQAMFWGIAAGTMGGAAFYLSLRASGKSLESGDSLTD